MKHPRSLNGRQRAFADAYAGPGTGVAAARAAGYQGDAHTLQVAASKFLRHPGIRARIEERLGAAQLEAPPEPPPKPRDEAGLVKGKGRGTQTERIEMLMRMARRRGELTESDRIRMNVILAAAELEGERRPGVRRDPRSRTGILPPLPAPDPVQPPKTAPLRLVLNERDRALEKGGGNG